MLNAVKRFGELNNGQLSFDPPLKTRRVGAIDGIEQAFVFVVGFVAHPQDGYGQPPKCLAGRVGEQKITQLVRLRYLQRLPRQQF